MISFVIPVFRSERYLIELFERIVTVAQKNSWKFEVIFIEDSGGDNSWEVIEALSKKNRNVRGFQMSRNYGQHNALLCGIREARGDTIVTLDDDLQHLPEEVPKLLSILSAEVDVVYGPPEQEQHGLLRDLSSRVTKLVLERAMGATTARQVSSLRAFKTSLRGAFSDYRSPMVNIDVLLTWGTTKFSAVRVRHESRKHGSSGYTSKKLIIHAINMMTGFSILPLQLASLMGLVLFVFGILVLTYVLVIWLFRDSVVPGFVFLSSIIALFSGGQLLVLGIIGEYLARIYSRAMDRPPFVVSQQTQRLF